MQKSTRQAAAKVEDIIRAHGGSDATPPQRQKLRQVLMSKGRKNTATATEVKGWVWTREFSQSKPPRGTQLDWAKTKTSLVDRLLGNIGKPIKLHIEPAAGNDDDDNDPPRPLVPWVELDVSAQVIDLITTEFTAAAKPSTFLESST